MKLITESASKICRAFICCSSSLGASRRGQMAITIVISVLLLLLIAIPMMDTYVKNEAKWSVKERKSTLAFHQAEAGLDRGYWKIKENDINWTTLADGGTIDGYDDDVVYSDIPGGSYKIKMQQGDTNLQVKITATGKDTSNNEYRALRAVYAKEGVVAALQAGSVAGGGNVEVHWGPMLSISGMVLNGASNQLYPRKYARGSITTSGGYPNRDSDINTTPNKGPHTNDGHIEWWSYNEPPGVPNILTPNTSYYISLAKTQTCVPAGTEGCYYNVADWSLNNLVDTTCTVGADPKVRVYTGNATFGGNKYFCGVLIVLGNLTFSGGSSNSGRITVTPPENAWKEYQLNVPSHRGDDDPGPMATWAYELTGDPHDPVHPSWCDVSPHGDTAAEDEYPGDDGYHVAPSSYNFYDGRVATSEMGGVAKADLSYNGYIYTAGTFNKGSDRIYGSVQVAGAGGMSGGGDIFYNDGLDIEFLNVNITRSSWYEVTPVPF